jgi:NAD(P)-dependent dehydrogenase (short-subunit alcohol dehydrogenase family)
MTGNGITGQAILVFGGTGNLGHAVVERFAAGGAAVTVADARLPIQGRAHPGATYITADVLDEAAVAGAVAGLPAGPAAVVNLVGGYTPPQPIRDLDLAVLREQLELNLVSAAIITKYALARLADQGGGTIVHTSSRVAVQSGENGFAYSASKLGVTRLVEAAAAEGRAHGVTVNCILPSIIDTPVNRAAMPDAPHHKWPKPAEIAAVLAFLVSPDARLISGAAIPVYGQA